MIKRDTKKTKIEKKTDFLNADQRKELKRRLVDKFTKLYGYANPSRTKQMVEDFFAATPELNAQAIAELEIVVKRDALQYKSLTKAKQAEQLRAQAQAPAPEEPCSTQQQSVRQSVISDADERDGDHWDSVGMYQALLLRQEQDLANQRKLLQQKAMKAQLDGQMNEKQGKARRNDAEHQSYVDAETRMQNAYKARIEAEEHMRNTEKQNLKDMQLKAIEERNKQLEAEKSREKQLDDKIVSCLNDDLARQKQLQMVRGEEKKREAHTLMVENEARKQKRLDDERRARQEEIELQKLANEVQDELERRKLAQQQLKHDKIQQLLSVGEKVVKTQQDKNNAEEARIAKYNEKKNREAAKKEARVRELELANRNKYRDFLDQQIQEKDAKAKAQDDYVREQADIWKRGEDVYSGVNAQNKENNKTSMAQYKADLERQMRDKEEKERRRKQADKPNEEMMKLTLMARIQELDIKKRVLADQLNGANLM